MKLIAVLLLTVIICAAVKRVYSVEGSQVVRIEDLKANWKAYSDALNDDGVWVSWNTSNKGVPSNAVNAGFDRAGPSFVIRAEHATADGNQPAKLSENIFH
ncbi:hypothetical protein ACKWTF_015069 [Chironomus riparius]